ncbi:MAG: hypothetical protein SFU21_11300 [Flavihumibacter sp.]|nr:hypothetical protein [Flavihumibacter sp.]
MKAFFTNAKFLFILFILSLVTTFIYARFMGSQVSPLTSKQIVAFEIAKTPAKATAQLAQFKQQQLLPQLIKSIQLDYGFLLIYPLALLFGALFFGSISKSGFLKEAGYVLVVAAVAAGVLDAVENNAMLQTIQAQVTQATVTTAYYAALIKFCIIGLVLLYAVACVVSRIINRKK